MDNLVNAASDRQERAAIVLALLITLVTVIGAIVAWRVSLLDDQQSDANYTGLASAFQSVDVRTLAAAQAYQEYRAYTRFHRYDALRERLANDSAASPREREEAEQLAANAFAFFSSQYVTPDDRYDARRQIREQIAEAALDRDVDASAHFVSSDTARDKGSLLLLVPIVLAVAGLCYILAEKLAGTMLFLFAAAGSAVFVAGVVVFLRIEFAP